MGLHEEQLSINPKLGKVDTTVTCTLPNTFHFVRLKPTVLQVGLGCVTDEAESCEQRITARSLDESRVFTSFPDDCPAGGGGGGGESIQFFGLRSVQEATRYQRLV